MGTRLGVYAGVWTSLVHFSQAEKRFFEIVKGAKDRNKGTEKCKADEAASRLRGGIYTWDSDALRKGDGKMKTRLVKIGKSRGIRLPKAIIERLGLEQEIELEVWPDEVVVRSAKRKPREGWAESFKAMAEAGDDVLIDGPLPSLTKFDEEEWEW